MFHNRNRRKRPTVTKQPPAKKSPPRSVARLIAGRFERGRHYWAFDETTGKAAPVVVFGTNPEVDAGGCVSISWRSNGDQQRIDPRHLFDNACDCESARRATAAEATPRRGRGRPFAAVQKTTRQLGRVSAEDWATMQEAAKLSGQTFTAFAVDAILRRAHRVIIDAGGVVG